jgi:4-alpha-glucanotransferase
MPLFSLPSPYGIGCFSQEAYEFVDWLAEAGQQYWQLLPLGPVGGGNSPYQPHSCFAGESLYIDPLTLLRRGMITREELDAATDAVASDDSDGGEDFVRRVDFPALKVSRDRLLRIAFSRFQAGEMFEEFCRRNSFWLDDYAMFEALSGLFGTASWNEWPAAARFKIRWKMKVYAEQLAEEIRFQKWMQYEFFRQWAKLKRYANIKGVQIIGDLPIYAALESADCWAHPEYFQLGGDGTPTKVSGAPPDSFCPNGQIWGNPLYDWDIMKRWDYGWWIDRVRHNLRIYDVVRLDHMRGFESYFAIPAGDKDAHNGQWEQGPGSEFFRVLREELGDCDMIAEDLGIITPEVEAMVKDSEMPGMRVLQFGFDGDPQNMHLPANYDGNVVVYTGTHDNDTTAGWYASLSEEEKRMVTLYIRTYYGIRDTEHAPEFGAYAACEHLVEMAQQSRAPICIIPIQDYLRLGSEARINVPGTAEGNWAWRVQSEALDADLAAHVHRITVRSGRLNRRG